MRFRKTMSAALAAALAVSTASICAFAAEDKEMKEEMTYVKQRLDIPEELSEFNYSTGTQYNKNKYNFSWSVPQDKVDYTTPGKLISLNVNISGNVITNIYVNKVYSDDNWKASFAKLSDAELIASAKEYINAINPTITKNTVIDEDSLNISLFGNEATLRFYRVANGVKVTGQTGTISIDKNTGELIRYNYNWITGAGFSDTTNAISEDEAKKAYQELFGSDLIYTLSYDWETKKFTPHLVYRQNSYGQINAFTGKLSVFEDYEAYGSDDIAEETEAAAYDADNGIRANASGQAKEVTFTQAELEKLEKENSLIKAEDALKALKKYDFFMLPDSCEVTWQNCRYNEQKGYYIRSVSFSADIKDYYDLNSEEYKIMVENGMGDDSASGSFTYNAETGELFSFSNFSYDNGTNLSETTAKTIAEKAAKALLGNKYSKFEANPESNSSTRYLEYDRRTGQGIGNPITTSVSYNANREAYGIKCENESYSLTVNNSGYVSRFSVNYYDDVTYPKPDNIISADSAYKNFFDNVDFGLRYRCAYRSNDKKTVTALVYAADSTLSIDAFTGKRVNYDGSELYVSDTSDYTDLEGSKYKEYAEKLASYGIRLMDKSGKLSEKEAVTAADFVQLIESIGMYGSSVDAEAVKAYNIEEETKLDRKTAAVVLVMAKYGNEVAELTSIFKNKFSDIKDDSKYLGYAMISDASGWITGSDNGKFYPDSAFTRGDAIKLVYDYLTKASE